MPGQLQALLASADRILLLQGPLGYFFSDFADWLQLHGKTVFKIHFNYGDELFWRSHAQASAYRGNCQDFPDFLAGFVNRHQIQAIVCFGDNRLYHLAAKKLCRQNQATSFWVFEEGYFRPFYVTLERDGVNAFSPLPRDRHFFLQTYPTLAVKDYHEPPPVPGGFWPIATTAARYYLAANLKRRQYPHYVHHRHFDLWHYIRLWSISGLKRLNYWLRDHNFARRVEKGEFGRFFLLPLQVFNDSQVKVHSDFSSVRNMLQHTLTSFAIHAPQDTQLIVKHHPMDRGFINYQKEIDAFVRKYPNMKNRVFYVHDVPLPPLLRQCAGVVTLNSTTGLSALIHNVPVKILGRASYDIPGITDQQKLADFWHHPTAPDREAFHAYRMYHINHTQIHGSFYSRVNLPR